MTRLAYRYRFDDRVNLNDAKDTLVLAHLAAQGLFGPCRVRMDAPSTSDESINVIVIDASTLVGMTISLIFTAFLTAEFSAAAFDVRQVEVSQ